jgi:hypothetical protein
VPGSESSRNVKKFQKLGFKLDKYAECDKVRSQSAHETNQKRSEPSLKQSRDRTRSNEEELKQEVLIRGYLPSGVDSFCCRKICLRTGRLPLELDLNPRYKILNMDTDFLSNLSKLIHEREG